MARATGLEPATSGVTGRHSNRLSYARIQIEPRASPERGGTVTRTGPRLSSDMRPRPAKENSRPQSSDIEREDKRKSRAPPDIALGTCLGHCPKQPH